MKIESFSIRFSTVVIFGMIGITAMVLSLFAGSYFKQAALDAQINSLSRVIEVASQETLKQLRNHTFDIGTKLGHNTDLITTVQNSMVSGKTKMLVEMLNDPFINGFVGFSEVDLENIRVYDLDLKLVAESNAGSNQLKAELDTYLADIIRNRDRRDRLKAVDALWLSAQGPLFSTIVPLGGLRPVGYLEVVVNPLFNLPGIGNITKTPVQIYSTTGELINKNEQEISQGYLPVEFKLHTSDGQAAFTIIGYENIEALNAEMNQTRNVTITGFLMLTLATLMFALWLFHRFLFSPVKRMVSDMGQVTHGNLNLTVNNEGLREIHVLADAFNTMTNHVRMRTNDLQRLLDLDESALMCFDQDSDAVYFNKAATALFGYASDEIIDLDTADLFSDDIEAMLSNSDIVEKDTTTLESQNIHTPLQCKHKDGHTFNSNAIINEVAVMGKSGFAIALNLSSEGANDEDKPSEQRLDAVEKTLSSLMAFAKDNPGVLSGLGQDELANLNNVDILDQKTLLREHVVKVMNLALECWQNELRKDKIDLAEESGIWPVYIDKSTPTTRTLDKYLNIDSCPKNPRSQRALDTAQFVLRQLESTGSEKCKELEGALDTFRQLLTGIKSSSK
jgi:PAS domain S-box-containing protein